MGGIVGTNQSTGTISHCSFAGTLNRNHRDWSSNNYEYGGIVGGNSGTVTDNLVIGATIYQVPTNYSQGGERYMTGYGAIFGHQHTGTIARNYYTDVTTVTTEPDGNSGFVKNENVTGIGSGGYVNILDLNNPDNYPDGAVPALRDNADNSNAIALMAAASDVLGKYDVQLTGRTLYKDNSWNTLCLPFDVESFTGTPLAGATVMELANSQASGTGFDASTGTLTLNFVDANSIEAGHAYIVKWTSGSNIVNPVFTSVTIENEDPYDQKAVSNDGYVQFVGTYSPVGIYAAEKTNLYLGASNTLKCPATDGYTLNSFRAYFQLLNGLTIGDGAFSVRAFNLNFGDDADGIGSIQNSKVKIQNDTEAWFDLSGRRVQKPGKGLYINNGKKIIIK